MAEALTEYELQRLAHIQVRSTSFPPCSRALFSRTRSTQRNQEYMQRLGVLGSAALVGRLPAKSAPSGDGKRKA